MKVIPDRLLKAKDIAQMTGFSPTIVSRIIKQANEHLKSQGKNSYSKGYATLHSVYYVLGLSIIKEVDDIKILQKRSNR